MTSFNKKIIANAMADLDSDREKLRNKAFQILLPISESNPEALYPQWDTLVRILKKEAVSNPYVAIPLLANLIRIDSKHKFDILFDDFYSLILHESPVVSPHIAGNSGKIINARPGLQEKILDHLLTTDTRSQCRQKELLKSYVINALEDCFDHLQDKEAIMDYVRLQTTSESPTTRKRAKAFLNKHHHRENH